MRTGWWLLAAAMAAWAAPHAQASSPAVPDEVAAPVDTAVPGFDEAMALPDELRAEIRRRVVEPGGTKAEKLDRLAAYVIGKDGLALVYDNDSTRTVAGTYAQRRANCLSFSMLFIALAREAGLEAKMQEVGEILIWHQGQTAVFASNHVNVLVRVESRWKEVDIVSSVVSLGGEPRGANDRRMMAHFHNNRGVEAMIDGDTAMAEASLRAALDADPGFVPAWTNHGVLLMRQGDTAGAERAYLAALRKDRRYSPALGNLVSLYRARGDADKQARYQRRLDQARRVDPFHQFMLALSCESDGDYDCAITRYQQAINLRRKEHQFHFGLSRAYFLSGNLAAAQRELGRAHALAGNDAERSVYLRKLEGLRRWHGQASTQLRQ